MIIAGAVAIGMMIPWVDHRTEREKIETYANYQVSDTCERMMMSKDERIKSLWITAQALVERANAFKAAGHDTCIPRFLAERALSAYERAVNEAIDAVPHD